MCYADIAPSAPHALHMPSHIFTRVGLWEQSAATNRRSVAAEKAENGVPFHQWDYMVYAYLQLARDAEASRIIVEEQQVSGTRGLNVAYARAALPARYAVERGMWKEAALLAEPQTSKFPYTEAITYFARALGAARSGNPTAAEEDAEQLSRIVDALKAVKNDYWATEVEVQRLSAAAWIAYAGGKRDDALTLMQSAADLEDKSEKSAVSPGRLVPARELLGDMLLESGRPVEAFAEYQASQLRDPKRFRGFYGAAEAAAAAGDRDKARYYFSQLIAMAGTGDPRPELSRARDYLAAQ
jgi:tetratricopeptide (TPR) repeat protein